MEVQLKTTHDSLRECPSRRWSVGTGTVGVGIGESHSIFHDSVEGSQIGVKVKGHHDQRNEEEEQLETQVHFRLQITDNI